MFLNKINKLTLASCKNILEEYYRQIQDTIQGEKEKYISATINYPAEHAFTAAQKAFILTTFRKLCFEIYENLKR